MEKGELRLGLPEALMRLEERVTKLTAIATLLVVQYLGFPQILASLSQTHPKHLDSIPY